jgi:acyl CoA:acetate/3-ketoacid CoA transferase
VSKLAGTSVGPGGFIDIVHGSRKIVFCGTFSTKGLSVSLKNNLLKIDSEGKIVKIVDKVEQITFSSQSARDDKRSAIYVTERAVFELTASGIKLIEVAPGVDVQKDVIKLLPATVDTSQWVFMDSELFKLAESTKE